MLGHLSLVQPPNNAELLINVEAWVDDRLLAIFTKMHAEFHGSCRARS